MKNFRLWLGGWFIGDKMLADSLVEFLLHAVHHIENGGNMSTATVEMNKDLTIKFTMSRVEKELTL